VSVGWAYAQGPASDPGHGAISEGPGAAGFGGEWGGAGDVTGGSAAGDHGGGGGSW
jgi:hypothetical protein